MIITIENHGLSPDVESMIRLNHTTDTTAADGLIIEFGTENEFFDPVGVKIELTPEDLDHIVSIFPHKYKNLRP